jgi:flagellar motility protein MotE (MotC chaperone)
MNKSKRFFAFVFGGIMICGNIAKSNESTSVSEPGSTELVQKVEQSNEEKVLEDFKKNKSSIEAKQKELQKREAELKAREVILSEEQKKLSDLRDSISKKVEERNQEHDQKVAKLVETLLSMSPKSAAKILSKVDDQLAVSALNQMDSQPLAKIMNTMDPVKSSQLSELMTGNQKKKGGTPDGTSNSTIQHSGTTGVVSDAQSDGTKEN